MMASVVDPTVERILALVLDRTGLRLAPARGLEAEASVRRAMGRAGQQDLARYLRLLQTGTVALDGLVAELTVRETYFLRDAAHFELVRSVVLPDVLARRGEGHALRAWSAGCASGEEAYSLAMVLEATPAVILGTDIAQDALRAAEAAVYGRWSLRALDDAQITRWFRPVGERWQLDDGIRRGVSFAVHNLLRHPYPSVSAGIWGMDVIFCRNVLMYFDASDREKVARGFHDSLADGGWLVVGPSDPSLDGLGSLRAVTTDAGVLYRRAPSVARPAPARSETPFARLEAAAPLPAAPAVAPPSRLERAEQAFAAGD